jgi:hypothetical protein
MTRAKDISKIITDADFSGTLDVAGELQVGVDGTTAGLIRLMDSGSVTEEATISTDANGGLIFGGNSGPGELIFKTSSGTERVRITSGGNVGIGTTSPDSKLDVATGANGAIFRYDTASTFLQILPEDANGDISLRYRANSGSAPDLLFKNDGGTEAMRITSSGNVGIGTSSPASYYSTELVVATSDNGGITLANSDTSHASYIMFADGTTGSQQYTGQFGYDHNTDAMVFHTNVSERMRIDSSGNVGIGTSNAHKRLTVGDSDATAYISAGANNTHLTLASIGTGGAVIFKTGGTNGDATTTTERMRVTNTGNVFIGDSSVDVTSKLVVSGNGSANTGTFMYDGSAGTYFDINTNAANGSVDLEANARSGGYPPLTFITGGSERMRIDSSGNVGIGGTSFNPKLYVLNNNAGPFLTAANATAVFHGSVDIGKGGCIGFDFGASHTNYPVGMGYVIESQSGSTKGSLVFGTRNVTTDTAPTERMRINSSGELLYGTTVSENNSLITINNKTSHLGKNGITFCTSSTGTAFSHLLFLNPNGNVGSVTTNGSSTAYNTSSDHRLKENVDYTFDATTRLKQLRPARFNFIADADTTVDGFLAHEVQSVVPEAITGTHNEVDDDGNPVYQGIDQSKLVPLLVKTIQELEARITVLETA